MSVGLGFIYQALKNKSPITFVGDNNLDADDFTDEERELLSYVKRHALSYSSLPSVETVEVEVGITFPDFPDESLSYWSDLIIDRTIKTRLESSLLQAQKELTKGNTNGSIDLIKSAFLRASERKGVHIVKSFTALASEVLSDHNKIRRDIEDVGIPFGFPFLDNQTNGAQNSDFIAIVARVSVGKTYLLLRMALAALNAGKSVLFVGTEMQPLQYARRLLALKTKISVDRIRMGRLSTPFGERTITNTIQELIDGNLDFNIMCGSLSTSLEDVLLQVKERKPDIVYIDGAYLLKPTNVRITSRFESISYTAETLKALAQEVDRPIIATYQMKRKTAGGLDDIYMSDAIAQVGSIVLSIKHVDPQTVDLVDSQLNNYRVLELLKGREGECGKLLISYDLKNMNISEVQELDV